MTTETLDAMTFAELLSVRDSKSWDGRGYSDFDRAYAADEITERLEKSTKRGIKVGDTIEFVRHGSTPESGVSRNHRDGFAEEGLSVYLLDGEEVVYVGFHFDIATRPAYRGTGVIAGFGSDGEPLVTVVSIKRDNKFDN